MIDWLYQKALKSFLSSGKFASLVRHGISALGGYLMAQGLTQEVVLPWIDPTTDLVVAGLMLLASYLMSRIEKKDR